MSTKIQKVKALELIMDWNLWPRYEARELNMPHIKRMIETLQVGGTLPPIIVDAKSNRIIDGFHRTRAFLKCFGDGAEIEAELREFKDETAMLLESIKINTRHGLPLKSEDRIHAILRLRQMKAPWPVIADALGMDKEKMKRFFEERTAMTENGHKIPVAGPAANSLRRKYKRESGEEVSLSSITLTQDEEKFARSSGGVLPIVHARLLINALRAVACPLTDDEAEVLRELMTLIKDALAKKTEKPIFKERAMHEEKPTREERARNREKPTM